MTIKLLRQIEVANYNYKKRKKKIKKRKKKGIKKKKKNIEKINK